jgi:adenylate cyclase
LVGTFSFLSDKLVERKRTKLSYGRSILIKSGILFITTLLAFLTAYLIEGDAVNLDGRSRITYALGQVTFYIALAFVLFGSVVFYTGSIVNKKFGKGMFIKILLGVYRKPIEEERLFMFIDLKSSTTIAEKLGNWDFSSLMQQIFLSVNYAVRNTSAEIYQYLGDGILMTWPASDVNVREAIFLHFEIKRVIASESEIYKDKFGLVPEFKSGIHLGKVTAAEIGDIRKEVSYHGDVINTAARLESYCNTLGADIVISDVMAEKVKMLKLPYELSQHENVELRGKEALQTVWVVSEL